MPSFVKNITKDNYIRYRVAGVLGSLLMIAAPASAAAPQPLQEPPVFASQSGTLAVLMVAAKRPSVAISTPLGTVTTDLWTYEVCYLPAPGANACPAGQGQSGWRCSPATRCASGW